MIVTRKILPWTALDQNIDFLILGYLLPLNGKYIATPRPSYEADNSEYLSINPTITGGVLGSDLYVFYSSIIKSTILVIK